MADIGSSSTANPGQFFACCGLFELSELPHRRRSLVCRRGAEFVISTEALCRRRT